MVDFEITFIPTRQMPHFSIDKCRAGEKQRQTPDHHARQFCITWPAQAFVGDWVHHRQVAINADYDDEVDATAGTHEDGCIDDFAQEVTEWPVVSVGCTLSPERQEDSQQEVGSSQVTQVYLSHGASLLMEAEY